MKLRALLIPVAATLLVLTGCDPDEEPQAVPTPTVIESPSMSPPPSPSPTPSPSLEVITGSGCDNEAEVVANGETISGLSASGTGAEDEIDAEVVADPDAPLGCQVFLVATIGGVTSSNVIVGDIQLDLIPPQVGTLANIDGVDGPEAFVIVQSGASTQFGALFLLDPVRPVTFGDLERGTSDLMAFGGGVTHLDGAACVPDEAGTVVISGAGSQGKRFQLERRFYRFEDDLLVEVRLERSKESFNGLSSYPEFATEPFANCPP